MRSQWKNIETPLAPFSRDIVILGGIFSVITTLLIPYIPIEGRSIGIAMIFLLGGRYIQQVSLGMAGPVVIAGAFVFSVVYGSLWTLGISIVFFYIFRVIEQVSEELFERVDTRLIPLILIQQGDIVSPNSRKDIQELL